MDHNGSRAVLYEWHFVERQVGPRWRVLVGAPPKGSKEVDPLLSERSDPPRGVHLPPDARSIRLGSDVPKQKDEEEGREEEYRPGKRRRCGRACPSHGQRLRNSGRGVAAEQGPTADVMHVGWILWLTDASQGQVGGSPPARPRPGPRDHRRLAAQTPASPGLVIALQAHLAAPVDLGSFGLRCPAAVSPKVPVHVDHQVRGS